MWGDCLPKDTQLGSSAAGPQTPSDPVCPPGLASSLCTCRADSIFLVPTDPSTGPGHPEYVVNQRPFITNYQNHGPCRLYARGVVTLASPSQ